MSRFGTIGEQYFDDSGDPLISGKLFFDEPGTTTDKDTFADVGLTITNTNPVILTAAGRQPNIFFSGLARAVLTDKDSVQIEVRDPVGDETTAVSFPDWNADAIWNKPDIVVGSDDNFYLSITDGNRANDPTASPTNWSQVRFINVWNTNQVYAINEIAQGSDGLLYTSKFSSNVGNDPVTDFTNWRTASDAPIPAVIRAAGKTFAFNNFS